MKDLLTIALESSEAESRSKLKRHAQALSVLRYVKKWSCQKIADFIGDPEKVGVENVVEADQSTIWDFFKAEKARERQRKLAQHKLEKVPHRQGDAHVGTAPPSERDLMRSPDLLLSEPPSVQVAPPTDRVVFRPRATKSSRFAPSELLTNVEIDEDEDRGRDGDGNRRGLDAAKIGRSTRRAPGPKSGKR